MPQAKIYASQAGRQAAYRQRCQEARLRQLQEKGLPAVPALSTIPGTGRWRQAIANAAALLSTVAQEMEAYSDERSEEWQESDRAIAFQERLDAVREANDAIGELLTEGCGT